MAEHVLLNDDELNCAFRAIAEDPAFANYDESASESSSDEENYVKITTEERELLLSDDLASNADTPQ